MVGALKLAAGRWQIVNNAGEIHELTSGEVFHVEADLGKISGFGLVTTRLEFAHDGKGGGSYYSVDGYPLRTGLRAATYTGQ